MVYVGPTLLSTPLLLNPQAIRKLIPTPNCTGDGTTGAVQTLTHRPSRGAAGPSVHGEPGGRWGTPGAGRLGSHLGSDHASPWRRPLAMWVKSALGSSHPARVGSAPRLPEQLPWGQLTPPSAPSS